jgi:hypothetical protein
VKRDMDVIRTLLLKLEGRYKGIGTVIFDHGDEELAIEGVSPMAVTYHLGLVVEAGFVTGKVTGTGGFMMNGMTWAGHDFLDSVRDEEIWRRTKEGVNLAGGFTFDLMKGLAKGFVKKKVESLTGIEVML